MNYLTKEFINLPKLLEEFHYPKSGAIVLFTGETRNYSKEKKVLYLEYEAHEIRANKMIEEILLEAIEKWELHKAICIHRLGIVKPTESAVVVITSSAHRKAAFAANQFIIDTVKKNVPIWKKEIYSDNSNEWKED
ncbi:MAG: molybdenum cofactor biosynthesis protein MoaE [Leptospiraceae bacterium]|nr:molybdenum cofactor biosynthesis protein MoaE [Leptospiraceae bacterium]